MCTMRFYLGLMSQTPLSLESASVKFNPNKLRRTFFSLSLQFKLKTDDSFIQPTYSVCLSVAVHVHVCVRVRVCACEWLTWKITSNPVVLLLLPFWGSLRPISKSLHHLLPNGNLYNKSVSCEEKIWLFPSPHLEIPHLPPENAAWCQAVEMGEKSGSLAVYGTAREAVRTLHLTALLSEPTQNPRTIALCHLELWHTLIMPSRLEICTRHRLSSSMYHV